MTEEQVMLYIERLFKIKDQIAGRMGRCFEVGIVADTYNLLELKTSPQVGNRVLFVKEAVAWSPALNQAVRDVVEAQDEL